MRDPLRWNLLPGDQRRRTQRGDSWAAARLSDDLQATAAVRREMQTAAQVLFLSASTYSEPLDATQGKKWALLAGLGEMVVIGHAAGWRPRRFHAHATFYLIPRVPVPLLNYVLRAVTNVILGGWLVTRRPVSVLVAQSPLEGVAGALVRGIARRMGRRTTLVVESHGDFDQGILVQYGRGAPWAVRGMIAWLVRRGVEAADVLRAVSVATRSQLEAMGAAPRPVVVFPAWTDLDLFLAVPDRFVSASAPEILFIGSLVPGKGVHDLVEAFARLAAQHPSARLVLIGPLSNQGYVTRLGRRITVLGLDARVRFMGELPQSELAGWLARAALLVIPSRSEGLGRVILEAFAAGVPVLACRVGGVVDLVRPEVTGWLVEPGDVDALTGRIAWVLAHPEQAAAVAVRARAFAREMRFTERYVAGYRELLTLAVNLPP